MGKYSHITKKNTQPGKRIQITKQSIYILEVHNCLGSHFFPIEISKSKLKKKKKTPFLKL